MEKKVNLTQEYFERARVQMRKNDLFQRGITLVKQLVNEFESDKLLVVVNVDPKFWISINEYEKYRGCKIDEIGEFEDHFIFGDFTPSRSCLLSFVAELTGLLKKNQSKDILYFSVGNFVRKETEITPGIREIIFPQLEVEILTKNFDESKCLSLLFKIQSRLFELMGFKSKPMVRQNNQDFFVNTVSDIDYILQRKVRSLMDDLETARRKGNINVVKKVSKAILTLIPTRLHQIFQQWFNSNLKLISKKPLVYQSDTLVAGPLTYEGTIFETDYTTSGGDLFVEVAGGGNFTPLAKRFGLPDKWLVIGFAVGLLRLNTALMMEQ